MYGDIAIGVGAFVAGFVVLRVLDGGETLPPPMAPPAPSPTPSGGPLQITQGPIIAFPGRTYFVALSVSGLVSGLASPAAVERVARARGFTDVVVFTSRPQNWPGTLTGDFYVRGTYAGAQAEFQRKTSTFALSVVLNDVWMST